MHFDWTITLGNLISCFGFLLLAVTAWRDMNWRVKNLEEWRKEHMIDADARDQIIQRLDRLIIRIESFIGMQDQRKMGTIRTRKED